VVVAEGLLQQEKAQLLPPLQVQQVMVVQVLMLVQFLVQLMEVQQEILVEVVVLLLVNLQLDLL